jgi:hypothetical protein
MIIALYVVAAVIMAVGSLQNRTVIQIVGKRAQYGERKHVTV